MIAQYLGLGVLLVCSTLSAYYAFEAARWEARGAQMISRPHPCIVRFDLMRGITLSQLGVFVAAVLVQLMQVPHECVPYWFWSGWSSGWLLFLYSQHRLRIRGLHPLNDDSLHCEGKCP